MHRPFFLGIHHVLWKSRLLYYARVSHIHWGGGALYKNSSFCEKGLIDIDDLPQFDESTRTPVFSL
jgi:hypothetical protein